jgi:UDP-N-acetylmuramoyl-tripeptide--D-alanyl-D-alanine ligase
MKALAETLPVEFHTEYRQSAAELSRDLAAFVRAGDVVMVKSSNGIGFAKLVEHLITQFKPFKPAEAAA